MSPPLIELIAERGPVRFDEYMRLALYHPEYGYYASGAVRTGFGGQFVTSPELSPAFGRLWTTAFERVWSACGEPDAFTVTEIGAGEGGFAAAVLGAASGSFASALRYRIVEPIAALRERQRQRVGEIEWVESVDGLAPVEHGCVFANEVLDNLPARVVQAGGPGLEEVWIEEREGRLQEALRPAPDLAAHLSDLGVALPNGHRFEVQEASADFVRLAAGSIEQGAVYFVDYGDEAAALAEKPHGSLLCYSDAGVDDRYLERPGEKDITVHANWTLVRDVLRESGCAVDGPHTQRDVLDNLGAPALSTELKVEHDRSLRMGRGANAMRALAARSALGTLRDPGGLGGLGAIAGYKSVGTAEIV